VRRVFAAPGRGAVAMAARVAGGSRSRAWAASTGLASDAHIRAVTAEQLAAMHGIANTSR